MMGGKIVVRRPRVRGLAVRWEEQKVGGRVYRLSYRYDLLGRRTRLGHPGNFSYDFGDSTRYVYAGADLVSLTNSLGETTTFGWDPLGRLTRLVQANGMRTDRYYNDAGRVQYVRVNSPGWYIKYSPGPCQ